MDKTIVKGMTLLEQVIMVRQPIGVSELARQLGLTKSNAHRYLQTFVALGYISASNGRYAPTLKIWQQGSRVIARLDLKNTVRPIMQRLAQETMETVHLAISEAHEVVYIDKAEGVHSVRAFSEIGERAPAYCSATGKIFLAFHPTALDETLRYSLHRYTSETIIDPDELTAEVENVYQNGIALNRGEWDSTTGGISAPVWGADDQLIASLGLTFPLTRCTGSQWDTLVAHVRAAASEASQALGASQQQITNWSGENEHSSKG